MNLKQTTVRGKRVWTIDDRGKGGSGRRFFGPSKEAILRDYNREHAGTGLIEFTDEDRLAKHELGNRGTMLEAVRYFLARKPVSKIKTLGQAITDVKAEKKRIGVSESYTKHFAHVLQCFETFIGASVPVSDITPQNIKDFLAAKGGVASTQNGMRGRLVTFFSACVADGCCKEHPMTDDKVVPVNERSRVPKIHTVEQVRALFKAAQERFPHMIPFLVLGYFAGIRPDAADGEMSKLVPANIVVDEAIIDIPGEISKTGDRRIVDLSENAVAWLKVAPEPITIVTARYWRRKLSEAAGVPWSADVMRHCFASYHVKKHKKPGDTALQLGHEQSLKMLYKHYVAFVTDKAAEAYWGIAPDPLLKIVPKPKRARKNVIALTVQDAAAEG